MRPDLFENEFIRQGISFESEYRKAIPSGQERPMDVPATIKKIMDVSGFKQDRLAQSIRVSQGTISKWMNEGQSPRLDHWEELLRFAARYPALRHLAQGLHVSSVCVMGYVGAGNEILPEFEQVPPDGLEQIELSFEAPAGLIAFRVRGDSMYPRFRDGEAIVVWGDQKQDAAAYVGQDVAIRTTDGRRFIKELARGSRSGLFDLVSVNQSSVIKDVEPAWIGEIFMIVRAPKIVEAPALKPKPKRARR
jgi:repressor LexA